MLLVWNEVQMRKFLVILSFVVATITTTAPARAHPHVYIDARAVLHMKAGKVVAITQQWTFDAIFSGVVIKTFDKNEDKSFTGAELSALRAGAFNNLKNFNYFTVVRLGKKELKIEKVTRFAATVKDQRLTYSFTLQLPRPLNPKDRKLAFLFLDRTYYVAVELAKKRPVALTGAAPKGCKPVVREDTDNPIYYGSVVPLMVRFSCATS